MTTLAYIGLGSNLADPAQQIYAARQAIQALTNVQEHDFSSLYRSPAMTLADDSPQPDYMNAVMAIHTTLDPLSLLASLQHIEKQQGRVRSERWGARTLDLDILLYGDDVFESPDLVIPHYGITKRSFVLYPLFEIAPKLIIPNHGSLADCLAQCPLNGLTHVS
jgi:2-amino-4-hydroxy-6-hydroxymethyldihydropteridine diphosphokinase